MKEKQRIIVLASQQGSLFEKIVRACQNQSIDADVVALLSSRSGAQCMDRAMQLGLPAEVVNLRAFANMVDYDRAMLAALKKHSPDWIIMAGFMEKMGPLVIAEYAHRIINTHPSLLPKFGGQGMYGIHVHRAVIAAQEKITGITIHKVNKNYDEGEILAQKQVMVQAKDTAEDLQERLKAIEGEFYIDFLSKLMVTAPTK